MLCVKCEQQQLGRRKQHPVKCIRTDGHKIWLDSAAWLNSFFAVGSDLTETTTKACLCTFYCKLHNYNCTVTQRKILFYDRLWCTAQVQVHAKNALNCATDRETTILYVQSKGGNSAWRWRLVRRFLGESHFCETNAFHRHHVQVAWVVNSAS